MTKINKKLTKHIAKLANIPVSEKEAEDLADAFEETLEVVDQLQKIDVAQVEPTHQVTGLTNVFRKDEVNHQRMFSQKQALANASQTHNGYFVVPRVIKKDN